MIQISEMVRKAIVTAKASNARHFVGIIKDSPNTSYHGTQMHSKAFTKGGVYRLFVVAYPLELTIKPWRILLRQSTCPSTLWRHTFFYIPRSTHILAVSQHDTSVINALYDVHSVAVFMVTRLVDN